MQVVRFRKWFLLISALLVMASVVSLSLYRLNPGIDFTGGAAINVKYTEAISSNQIVEALSGVMQDDAVVQATADNSFFIRVGILELDQRDDSGQVVRRGEESEVRQALKSIGPGEIVSFDSVSGVIGDENVRNAIIAVIVASIVILVYVTWAFRRVPTPFRYGVAAIVALIHDVFIVLGVFSVCLLYTSDAADE